MKKLFLYISLVCSLLLAGCTHRSTKPATTAVSGPLGAFSADSAYRFIQEQVDFGARVPGSPAHEACAHYLISQLRRFGADVEVQQGQMINYAGEEQQVVNIIGRYGVQLSEGGKARKILLCSHWDSRPWSDQEEEYAARMTPVLGANDGASGVGVLLEIARQLQQQDSCPAVEIVFFDVEDMGNPDFYTGKQRQDTWCLGSQLWAKQARKSDFRYGILLDMVASPDAIFPKEYYSMQYASAEVESLWQTAAALGFGRFFRNERSYPVTDDHYYVNTLADIPCLDIIHYDQQSGTGFPEYWHTNHDDMKSVSPTTLDAVGKTVLTTILR